MAQYVRVTLISSSAVTCTSSCLRNDLYNSIYWVARPPRVFMRALPRNHQSCRTRTALVACWAALTLLLQLLASSQLESNLHSGSDLVIDAPMSSDAVRWGFACMGCTARSNGCGQPTFFNDYQSATTHYLHSIHCNNSMCRVKSVAVQMDSRPHFVGSGEAGAPSR
jgi:hypothetical protein